MDQGMLTIVVLAVIAAVLLFRLRDILGTKTGAEKPEQWLSGGAETTGSSGERGAVLEFPDRRRRASEDSADDIYDVVRRDTPVAQTLLDAKQIEPHLNIKEFMVGARKAYEMILVSFEQGDKDALKPWLADDVYQSFAAVIDDRRSKGYTVDARFVGLNDSRIEDARLDEASRTLEIDIRFEAEMITAMHDASGAIIQGDPNVMRRMVDVWTFARVLGASDPNWTLAATG